MRYTSVDYARHPAVAGASLRGNFGFSEATVSVKADSVTRVVDSFLRCEADNPTISAAPGKDIWEALYENNHKEIISIIRTKDADNVMNYLKNVHNTPFPKGIADHAEQIAKIKSDQQTAMRAAVVVASTLTALAEAAGVVTLNSPWQTPDLNIYRINLEQVLPVLEKEFGTALPLPTVFNGAFGLKTTRGVLTQEMARALLTAVQMKDYCKLLGIDFAEARICEIGGGAGMLAYFCYILGARNYVIYDLPTTNILQNYLLHGALPDGAVVTYDQYSQVKPGHVTILPYWTLDEYPKEGADLFVNEDSMPEIQRDIALGYIRKIKEKSRYFLSLNQESMDRLPNGHVQGPVGSLVKEVGGFDRLLRTQHWSLPGYAVELYRVV